MTFAQWQEFARRVNDTAKRVNDMRIDRAFSIAASVGIPRNACCLHNASIDDGFTGWCAGGNVKMLKTAKRATHILNNWEASRLAERITSRAWDQVQR